MLSTKWSTEAGNSIPLCEYPRPQFVRNSYLSLNGEWDYAISDDDSLPTAYQGEIVVPFSPETELSGVNKVLKPNEFLFYRKCFELPEGFNNGRVFINFGAVDQIATVYLNGEKLYKHIGGFTPFTVELTKYLNAQSNELVVAVRDLTDSSSLARGKQKMKRGGIWYSPQSGIWQSVWLESTPHNFLEGVKITPDYDNEQVKFEYKFNCIDKNADTSVEVLLYDGEELVVDTTDSVVKLPDFKSWSPENPFLYNVVFKTNKEKIKSYFGMRKFSCGIDSNGVWRLFLNNKPYFHNGLLDQGYYPDGFLTPPSNKALESDVKYAKKAGFNMLRKHIKIEPLLWYHYCDVNGIIVWQDIVNGGGNYGAEVSVIPFVGITLDDTKYKNFHRTDEFGRKAYYKDLNDTINYLYNCPCIAVWVLFNEGWGQFDSQRAYELAKQKDSTRTIDTTSGWHDLGHSDVVSKHIYFTPIKVKKTDKPYLLSEFGGLGLKVLNHTFNNRMFGYKIFKSNQSLTKAYSRLYNKVIIPQIKDGLSATVYTQLTDVEDELNGLLTYDRKIEKIDIEVLKNINERVKL